MYDRGMDKGKFSIYRHCETERSECRGNLSHSSFVIARPNEVSVAAIFREYAFVSRDWSLRLTRTFTEVGLKYAYVSRDCHALTGSQ